MKPITFIWLTLVGCAVLCYGTCKVDAWNRQIFNRYSRNLLRRANGLNAAAGGGSLDIKPSVNGIDEFNALFGINNDYNNRAAVALTNGLMDNDDQQQTEVYGIVEPLIEDMPCMDRPCNSNDDCCPTGVCVNTYGEGKCIYVYGRKRDNCQRNADCSAGMSCVRSEAGNMICQLMTVTMNLYADTRASDEKSTYQVKQFGEECATSFECNAMKGLCCQLQRTHHRMLPKQICNYFHDPFMCIDILPTDNEEIREARLLSSFNQRRM